MKKQVIGITGAARSGKDTVATMLQSAGINAAVVSLGSPIKRMLEVGLGLTVEQLHGALKERVDPRYGISPRELMQTLGTEWGRDIVDPDIWIKIVTTKYNKKVIIPDIRFENEAKYVRENGVLIHMLRVGVSINSDHVSERGVEIDREDFVITNNADMPALQSQVKRIAQYIMNDWK